MNASYKRSVFIQAAKVVHLTNQIGESNLLRKKSKEVNPDEIKSKKIQTIISKLTKTLFSYKKLTGKGKGISAVQIGIPLKIAVIFVNKKVEVFINPAVTKVSSDSFLYPEICMSANPIIAQITRPGWVEFEYLDENGLKKTWTEKDRLLNRVLEHEIDHMHGIINIDLVNSKDLILDFDPDYFKKAKFKRVQIKKSS